MSIFTAGQVHTFVCEGFLATAQSLPSRITFRVFADGTLTAKLSVLETKPTPFARDSRCFVHDGRAALSSVKGPVEGSEDAPSFDCSFKIERYWPNRFQSQLLVCHAKLSPSTGMRGHYVVVHRDGMRPHGQEIAVPLALHLPPVEHKLERLTTPMMPLTPGIFKFQGFTVNASGMVCECTITVELLADGSLQGSSLEQILPRPCPLCGSWRHDQVTFSLEYKLDTSVSSYEYTVTPSMGGLRGRWRLQNSLGGEVELLLESVSRVWSPPFHTLYPRVFQDATKLLLLKSLRSPTRTTYAIPGALWQNVLHFCDFDHFAVVVFKEKVLSEVQHKARDH